MKTKIYTVFNIEPDYYNQEYRPLGNPTYITPSKLNRIGQFDTQLAAIEFINQQDTGYGLNILEVWE